MGVAQDYENLRKKKEQNDAQTTEFHVAQAYNSMFGKEEETSEKIDLASYFRERAKAKQNKSNSQENKKSSSSVKENGISLPRSEVLDRVTQARMQRKSEESAAAAKKPVPRILPSVTSCRMLPQRLKAGPSICDFLALIVSR